MKRVLIVDDSRVARRMLKNMLETSGYEVVAEAINGKEGFELYKKLSPDVVTMDITMPELNGLEALAQIREFDPDAKVIVISAAGQDEKQKEALGLGAFKFITKPYENEDILNAIKEC
ncbi:MAG: response regulator [Butyrivibrio sp.]|nr:response regulator [Butyrivibrio sp.]